MKAKLYISDAKTLYDKLTSNHLLIYLIILIAATFFYFFNIGFSDLWSDEVYTKTMIKGSLSEFYANFKNDLHPPLYYLGLRYFTAVFGSSPVIMRLFSVIGVLSIFLLAYFAGQRVFGKAGAIYFCLMLLSIPMLAAYSHQARMYTWAAFSVTGVFMYSCLFIKTGKIQDLAFLFIFTIVAMYTHYYSCGAAFVANAFVFIYLILTKNRKWVHHLIALLIALLLFLPWIFMFIVQVKKVQHAFWAQPVSLQIILSCFTMPFTEQFWTTELSRAMILVFYAIVIFAVVKSFSKSLYEFRIAMWLSLSIFLGTILLFTIISLFSQPILFSRYVMAIVAMLAVPPAILFIKMKNDWLKVLFITVILVMGMKISVSTFYFSYGPYKQTIEYIDHTYPEIKKVLHLTEITAGPLVEYNGNSPLKHYWLKAPMSNVDAFTEIQQYEHPSEFLNPGEIFCTVRFSNLDLNEENFERVLSESVLLKTDTVCDNKVEDGIFIQLYLLQYEGNN